MAEAMAGADPDRAEALASSITGPEQREQARRGLNDLEMAHQAITVADSDHGRAEALAQKINSPDWQALILTNRAREAAPARAATHRAGIPSELLGAAVERARASGADYPDRDR